MWRVVLSRDVGLYPLMHVGEFGAAELSDDLGAELAHARQPFFVMGGFELHVSRYIWMGKDHEVLGLHGIRHPLRHDSRA